MHFEETPRDLDKSAEGGPWHRELTKYHWFVLIVAALGWLFDTMDQQLFNLARRPAMVELLGKPKTEVDAMPAEAKASYTAQLNKDVAFYSGVSTTVFMVGWALGGIAFGVLGDKIGRAKTMMITILFYSVFTGLSALAFDFWSFSLLRLLTGLGVGGEFAVGVALVAEVMPDRARPYALGRLQALSAVGNMTAAGIAMVLGKFEETGAIGSAWRIMFIVGTLPALLAIVIRRNLEEPERWQAAAAGDTKSAGSIREMFAHPVWRKHTIVGMLLAFSGVVGLWGIGFFSFDLMRVVFTPYYKEQGLSDDQIRGALTILTGLGSFAQNLGGFFGVEAFTKFTQKTGRRLAFAVSFPLAMVSTAFTFLFLGKFLGTWDVFWMLPIMGFCQLTLFGGYAIYLPELYPTRLRSTGTSFCYNVGRLVAAVGPLTLGSLAASLQTGYPTGDATPFRHAGLIMCSVFVIGLLVLPFAPETKGRPLPE
jgi:MFS family permease